MKARSDTAKKPARPDRLLFFGLVLLLIWLPLPWGSHTGWAQALMGLVVSGLSLGWIVLCLRGRVSWPQQRADLRWPLLLWLLWLGWIAFSLLPLPQSLLGLLSPRALEAHRAVAAAGGQPAWSLSISPGSTLSGLLLSLSYFQLYWLVVVLSQPRERVRLLLIALVVSGLAQGGYGAMMELSGLEYGFFERKVYYLGYATGTFINRNHFAGYLGLCLAAGVGLILADLDGSGAKRSWRQRLSDFINLMFSTKMQVRLSLAVMVVGVVLSRSRMGNTALFVALTVSGLGYVLLRERKLLPQALILFASLLIVDTLIVSQWFGLEKVVQRIEQTEVETEKRTDLYTELLPVIGHYPLTGAGLGAYESAYLPQRALDTLYRNDHAHNDYLEFLIETGPVGLGLLLALLGLHAVHALRVALKRQDRVRVGSSFAVLMAMIAAGLHASVEFNFQIPAYAATFVALLGLAAGNSQRARKRKRSAATDTRPEGIPPRQGSGYTEVN